MSDNEHADNLLKDIVFLECVGIKPILIHGGGNLITSRMKKAGKHSSFVHGLRVTDEETVNIVNDVLLEINGRIVSKIHEYGGRAQGLTSSDKIIVAKKHYVEEINKKTGKKEKIDIGNVGDVVKIKVSPIKQITDRIGVPVIAPVGVGSNGVLYNINADTAACGIAAAVKAEKLVLMTNTRGIMEDPHDIKTLIPSLKTKDISTLIANGVINSGMIPKVKACVLALRSGVHKIHIIDARILHSVLLEIFTDKGIGTQIMR